MCGRYSLSSDPRKVSKLFDIDNTANFQSRYNISPGQEAIAIYKKEEKLNMSFLNWGIKLNQRLNNSSLIINARSETINSNYRFKNFFKTNRCLIPANCWFEWNKFKQPFCIHSKKSVIIAFAGIIEKNISQNSNFVIATSSSEGGLAEIHRRTPVIIEKKDFDLWFNGTPKEALNLISPINSSDFNWYKVSRELGSVKNDYPSLLKEIKDPQGFLFS